MKKSIKKMLSLFLVTVFIFTVASTAYADNEYHQWGDPVNEDGKITPYGSIIGALYPYIDYDDYELTACTLINSSTTMARTTTKMECVDGITGESLEWDSSNLAEASRQNSNHCDFAYAGPKRHLDRW